MARGDIKFRNLWSCQDGVVCWRIFVANLGKWTGALFNWMNEDGLAADLSQVRWEDLDMATLSQEDIDRFEVPVQAFFQTYQGRAFRNPQAGFVLFFGTVRDLYENEQLKARTLAGGAIPSGPMIPHPPSIYNSGNELQPETTGIEHNQEIFDQRPRFRGTV
jgi:hypothetical protein